MDRKFSENLNKGDYYECTNLLINNSDNIISNLRSEDKNSFAFISEGNSEAFDRYQECKNRMLMNISHKKTMMGETSFFNMVEIATAKELLQRDVFVSGLLRLVIST